MVNKKEATKTHAPNVKQTSPTSKRIYAKEIKVQVAPEEVRKQSIPKHEQSEPSKPPRYW